MNLRIIPANLAHVLQITPALRLEDETELLSSTGKPPVETLAASLGVSVRAWVALDPQDRIVVLGGIQALSPGVGVPWMVASDRVLNHRREIARLTRPIIDALNRDFPVLTNSADCRNTLHLRWLEWAGFTFADPVTHLSADGSPFVQFTRIRLPDV